MRIPAPVSSLVEEASYMEIHTGLPMFMRIFLFTTRLSAYFLLAMLFTTPALLGGLFIEFSRWSFVILTMWQSFQFSRLDIFLPIGFRIFKHLLKEPP